MSQADLGALPQVEIGSDGMGSATPEQSLRLSFGLFVAATLALAAGLVSPIPMLTSILTVGGAVLFALAGWRTVSSIRKGRARLQLIDTAARLVSNDPDACYIADPAGRILHRNGAAEARAPTQTRTMADVLRDRVANPGALLARVQGPNGFAFVFAAYQNQSWVRCVSMMLDFDPEPEPTLLPVSEIQGLVVYWNFDESSGKTINDNSLNKINGEVFKINEHVSRMISNYTFNHIRHLKLYLFHLLPQYFFYQLVL